MKTLKNYIAEAFRINKNTKIEKPNGNLFKLDYDLMKKDGYRELEDIVYSEGNTNIDDYIKTVEIPKHKWYVYKDMYRNGKPNISTYVNMNGNILWFPGDFEDFSPKDILFSADTLDELINILLDEANLDKNDYSGKFDELAADIKKFLNLKDSERFLEEILHDSSRIEEETEGEEYDDNITLKNILNFNNI